MFISQSILVILVLNNATALCSELITEVKLMHSTEPLLENLSTWVTHACQKASKATVTRLEVGCPGCSVNEIIKLNPIKLRQYYSTYIQNT